jgi:hypothetical protein
VIIRSSSPGPSPFLAVEVDGLGPGHAAGACASSLGPSIHRGSIRPGGATNLRAFLATHHSRLVEALGHRRVTANTQAHGARRVAQLRELGAPDVIVDHDVAELARVGSARWRPQVDPYASLPDVLGTAGVVDVDARRASGDPLVVDADITDLVLLAAQCCIPPDATSLDAPWVEGLDWVAFPMSEEEEETGLAKDVVRVRPAINTETAEVLAFADVRGVPEAASLAPGGALLRVHVVASEQDI